MAVKPKHKYYDLRGLSYGSKKPESFSVRYIENLYLDNHGILRQVPKRARHPFAEGSVGVSFKPIAIVNYKEHAAKDVIAIFGKTGSNITGYLINNETALSNPNSHSINSGISVAYLKGDKISFYKYSKVDDIDAYNWFEYDTIFSKFYQKTCLYFTYGREVMRYAGGQTIFRVDWKTDPAFDTYTYLEELPPVYALCNHLGYMYYGTEDYLYWSNFEAPESVANWKYVGKPIYKLVSIGNVLIIFTEDEIFELIGVNVAFKFRSVGKMRAHPRTIQKVSNGIIFAAGDRFYFLKVEKGRIGIVDIAGDRVADLLREEGWSFNGPNQVWSAYWPDKKWYLCTIKYDSSTYRTILIDIGSGLTAVLTEPIAPLTYSYSEKAILSVENLSGTLKVYKELWQNSYDGTGVFEVDDLLGYEATRLNLRQVKLILERDTKDDISNLAFRYNQDHENSHKLVTAVKEDVPSTNLVEWGGMQWKDVTLRDNEIVGAQYYMNGLGREFGVRIGETLIKGFKLKGFEIMFKVRKAAWV